jgi:hypothetical protein
MRHGALVEAALLDQQRRILAATPQDLPISGRKRGRPSGGAAVRRGDCEGGCGRWKYRSNLANGRDSFRCRVCFPQVKAAKILADGPRCARPACAGRRLQRSRWDGHWYCSGKNHHVDG